MDRRHNRRHNKWSNNEHKNNSKNNKLESSKQFSESKKSPQPKRFHFVAPGNIEALAKQEEAIRKFKEKQIVCPKCGEAISDIASAISDKSKGIPVHFECVMNELTQNERLTPNERICYIGQGRFGVLHFENPRDQRHFSIKKIIEWEERDKKFDWRDEVSTLYSQIS